MAVAIPGRRGCGFRIFSTFILISRWISCFSCSIRESKVLRAILASCKDFCSRVNCRLVSCSSKLSRYPGGNSAYLLGYCIQQSPFFFHKRTFIRRWAFFKVENIALHLPAHDTYRFVTIAAIGDSQNCRWYRYFP